ncbi:hypothetical protein EG68_12382 [Paragonimus skrjabini miyazakii]|uniref:Uncharacterized protein n=1 Tax=Paragonimus skrjabini miyazakii TaxID=59628 RepID=A0A8S9YNK7_9TREM|nr:hypothetical protein EG68_12382 [Paragonimus skrjabini miyazakii]
MDTIAYQVFGVSFCGARTQGPKGAEFLWDDADKNSGCTPWSASSVVSLDGLLSESVTFTNSYLESDSGVDDGLDIPLEVVDLFVDYAASFICVSTCILIRFRIPPRAFAVLRYHTALMKAVMFVIVSQSAGLIYITVIPPECLDFPKSLQRTTIITR